MARWIALGFTLLCFASCSFTSTDPLRGIIAPLGVMVGMFVTVYFFVVERVASVSRGSDFVLDVADKELLKKLAASKRAEELKAKLAAIEAQKARNTQPTRSAE